MISPVELAVCQEKGRDVYKRQLMGPFAAIGDVIFSTIQGTIFGAIAGNMAIEGNPTGMIIWMLWYLFVIILRFNLFQLGYKQGVSIVSGMTNTLENITTGAGIVGLMVVGGLITSVVKFTIPISFQIGEVSIVIQDYLNKILPFLPPVSYTHLDVYKRQR